MTRGASGTRPIVRLASRRPGRYRETHGSMAHSARATRRSRGRRLRGRRCRAADAAAARGVPAGVARLPRQSPRGPGRGGVDHRPTDAGRPWRLHHCRRRRRRVRRTRCRTCSPAASRKASRVRSASSATAGPARAWRTFLASRSLMPAVPDAIPTRPVHSWKMPTWSRSSSARTTRRTRHRRRGTGRACARRWTRSASRRRGHGLSSAASHLPRGASRLRAAHLPRRPVRPPASADARAEAYRRGRLRRHHAPRASTDRRTHGRAVERPVPSLGGPVRRLGARHARSPARRMRLPPPPCPRTPPGARRSLRPRAVPARLPRSADGAMLRAETASAHRVPLGETRCAPVLACSPWWRRSSAASVPPRPPRRRDAGQGRHHRRSGRRGADPGLHQHRRCGRRRSRVARRDRGARLLARRRRLTRCCEAVERRDHRHLPRATASARRTRTAPLRQRRDDQRLGPERPEPPRRTTPTASPTARLPTTARMDRGAREAGAGLGHDLLERLLRARRGEGFARTSRRGAGRRTRRAPTRAHRWPSSAHLPTSPPTSSRAPRTSSPSPARRARTSRTARSSCPSPLRADGLGHLPHALRRRRSRRGSISPPTSRARTTTGMPSPATRRCQPVRRRAAS